MDRKSLRTLWRLSWSMVIPKNSVLQSIRVTAPLSRVSPLYCAVIFLIDASNLKLFSEGRICLLYFSRAPGTFYSICPKREPAFAQEPQTKPHCFPRTSNLKSWDLFASVIKPYCECGRCGVVTEYSAPGGSTWLWVLALPLQPCISHLMESQFLHHWNEGNNAWLTGLVW